MAEQKEPIPVYQVPHPAPPPMTTGPSTIRLVDDQAQVLVDTWGHRGEFVRGHILSRVDADKAGFDWDHAVTVGAIRLLTEAEVRSLPTTFSALADGSPDEGLARATRYHSGILDEVPQTVTTGQGSAMPAGINDEPGRPVRVVGSAEEARAAGAQQAQVVATPSGPAFATPEEAEEQRAAAEAGEPANEQRVSRRGRGRE
jgi:hypothetical protein